MSQTVDTSSNRPLAANNRELEPGAGSKPKNQTFIVGEEPGLSKGASENVLACLHDGFGEPLTDFHLSRQIHHLSLPPYLALGDLDALYVIGAHKVKDPRLDLVGFASVAFAEKDAVQPGAPDVAVAKITNLAAGFRDVDLKRPGHFLRLSPGGFRKSITALGAAISNHIVIDLPQRKEYS